jgi:hypothetical protein
VSGDRFYETPAVKETKRRIEQILDCSGSMNSSAAIGFGRSGGS